MLRPIRLRTVSYALAARVPEAALALDGSGHGRPPYCRPMARVTVCIPTYQRTRWLARTIESALGQTFGDLVVEVHDDATPGDAVVDVVARFDDPRLRLVAMRANAGIVGNFTRSLLGATTEYVIQLGDDDVACRTLVEKTVAALDAAPQRGDRALALRADRRRRRGAGGREDWLGTPSPPLEPGAAFVEQSMVHGCRVCSSTALIRRSAVPEGGFLQEDFPPFDFAFWLRMAETLGRRVRRRRCCAATGSTAQSYTSGLSDVTGDGLPAGRADAARGARASSAGTRRRCRRARGGRARAARGPGVAAGHRLPRARADAAGAAVRSRPRGASAGAARREPSLLREPTRLGAAGGQRRRPARRRAAKGSRVGPRRPRRR